MNYLEVFIHRYFPTFAAFASLREIFRVSVAASLRYVLRGEYSSALNLEKPRSKQLDSQDGFAVLPPIRS